MCCEEMTLEQKIENLQKKVEPVENFVKDHPIPSIAIGVGAGILIGALIGSHYRRLE